MRVKIKNISHPSMIDRLKIWMAFKVNILYCRLLNFFDI
jgi:hypothetical protein